MVVASYPRNACIHELFEEQVDRRADDVAVVYEGQCLTYGELDARANRLAHHLTSRGLARDAVVGLALERSLEVVVAIVAILKAGGAYLPMDPNDPLDRLARLAEDGSVGLVVTLEGFVERLPAQIATVCLDRDAAAIAAAPSARPGRRMLATQLAYVMYTSGSTGRPKGVAVQHRSVVRLVKNTDFASMSPEDVFLLLAPLAFDASTLEIWGALLNGGRLVVPRPGALSSEELGAIILEGAVTFLWLTAGLFHQVVSDQVEVLRPIRTLMSGGGVLSVPHVRRALESLPCRLINGYGPTENTTFTTCFTVNGATWSGSLPIGRPIANTTAYILDEAMQPVPVGTIGELYAGGDGVARGYSNRPDLTAARFVPDPFGDEPGGRLYRTGDFARHLPDGNIEFIGRIDEQVKIRGYRIELGEIEAVLAEHPALGAVAVAAHEEGTDKQLVAYVLALGEAPSTSELRAFLKQKLPAYMVPSVFVVLDALPLTPSGKVDRKALPRPARAITTTAYEAPRGPVEERLASLCEEILRVPRMGALDDFLECGGHSLLLMQLATRIERELHVVVPLRVLFESPTVRAMSRAIAEGSVDAATQRHAPIERARRDRPLVLSSAQERTWFLHSLDPKSPVYNVPVAFRLDGALDVRALARATDALVERHEILRTTYEGVDGQPVQRIGPPTSSILAVREAPGLDDAAVVRLAETHARAPFDLNGAPLFRATLLVRSPTSHVLLLNVHHIATDGWSLDTMIRELSLLYTAFVAGRASPLPDLSIQYADFAAWQRERAPESRTEAIAYWKEQLRSLAPLALPTDRPRPASFTNAGAIHRFVIPEVLSEALRAFGRREGTTLFVTVLAAFTALLSRYSRQADVAIGTAVADRPRPELEPLCGFFVNTVVLRTDLSGAPTVRDLLKRTRRTLLDAHAYKDLPFEAVVSELGIERDPSRTPLFDVMFLYEARSPLPSLGAVKADRIDAHPHACMFDLTLAITDGEPELKAVFEYRTDLWDPSSIEAMGVHLQALLAQMDASPMHTAATLPLMTERERAMIRDWGTPRKALAETPQLLHGLFERSAAERPEAVAVLTPDGRSMTYADLDARANRLAHRLLRLGARPEEPIALACERGMALAIGVLGILKAGGVYTPVETKLPAARQRLLVADSRARIVVVEGAAPAFEDVDVVTVDLEHEDLSSESAAPPPVKLVPGNASVLLYTSGSTGTPKGVVLEHQNLTGYFQAFAEHLNISSDDVTLAFASIGFDASTEELFSAWCSGAAVLMRNEAMLHPLVLVEACERAGVTILDLPTQYWQDLWSELDQAGRAWPARLRAIAIGGERANPERIADWNELTPVPARLINGYGPTETTQLVTWCETASLDRVTQRHEANIGRATPHCRLYILDERLEPVPPNVFGEICVGGVAVARGYLGGPSRTAASFSPDPFGEPGGRLYRTGDLGRFRPDGSVEFLGRLDHQVKIRGHRIEPSEVEAALARCKGVRDAVAVAQGEAADKHLVAYVTPRPGVRLDHAALRDEMRAALPEYMVPAVFVTLDDLPVNTNGKVDRGALPRPDLSVRTAAYIAPRTPLETQLAAIFADVLGVARVGVEEDFFLIGGHSLRAMQVALRVQTAVGVVLPVRTVFECPTVGALAIAVEKVTPLAVDAIVSGARPNPIPPSFAQQSMWLLEQLDPGVYHSGFALRLRGPLDVAVLRRALTEIVRRHESLRTSFEVGNQGLGQVIHEEALVPFERIEKAGDRPGADAIEDAARVAFEGPFDLEEGRPLRVRLVSYSPEDNLLVVPIHHIAIDGWSLDVFVRELTTLYAAFLTGTPPQLAEIPVQFADFALWQRRWLESGSCAADREYWKTQLTRVPELKLPLDRERRLPRVDPASRTCRFGLERSLSDAIGALGRNEGATTAMIYLAAFQILLHRQTGQVDFAIGTPVVNRTRAELVNVIGCIINTVAVRANLAGDPPAREVIRRTRTTLLDAQSHASLPFEVLLGELKLPRSVNRAPLFDVFFAVESPISTLAFGGLEAEAVEPEAKTNGFELTLLVTEGPSDVACSLIYRTALFDHSTIARMSEEYRHLLESIVSAPERASSALALRAPQDGARRTDSPHVRSGTQ